MTDKKYTDEGIIKALECTLGMHNNDAEFSMDCRGCAFERDEICDENCSDGIAKVALDVISRQKAKIERLQKEVSLVSIQFQDWQERAEEYKLKIKNLQNVISSQQIEVSENIEKQIKAEAYKEFAERLKDEIRLNDDCDYNCRECYYECKDYVIPVDNLLKEMVGEEE